MSNRVFLQATKFVDIPQHTENYGFRLSDDYARYYYDMLETIPESGLDLLREALKVDDPEITGLLNHVETNEKGMFLNGTWYDWDEIKAVFEEKKS